MRHLDLFPIFLAARSFILCFSACLRVPCVSEIPHRRFKCDQCQRRFVLIKWRICLWLLPWPFAWQPHRAAALLTVCFPTSNPVLDSNYAGLVTLSIGSDGNIVLVSGQDYYCYNYTLQTVFAAVPQVTVGTVYKWLSHQCPRVISIWRPVLFDQSPSRTLHKHSATHCCER